MSERPMSERAMNERSMNERSMTERPPDADPLAAVQAARAQGLAAADPVAFAVIDALARRAARHEGEARARMLARVAELLAAACARASAAAAEPANRPAHGSALPALSELVERLGRGLPSATGAGRDASVPMPLAQQAVPPVPLKSVVAFQGTWSRLRVAHRLRQALAQVPAGAGPLNSSHIVNRALESMRELSPAYLDAFMTHIDTLQWLEAASGAGDLKPRAAPAAADAPRAKRPPRRA